MCVCVCVCVREREREREREGEREIQWELQVVRYCWSLAHSKCSIKYVLLFSWVCAEDGKQEKDLSRFSDSPFVEVISSRLKRGLLFFFSFSVKTIRSR